MLEQLIYVINDSAYSDEVKSNYIGSLTTRVKSLTNGLNGQIFSSNEIDNDVLFDSNVIIDLSRIGAQETKALIMGILVMRLSEHRMSSSKNPNSRLRHITVLEEAHNILGKPYQSNPEGANISGKSVEMLSNAIAEMRTYGEGFIIADQSPGAVDASAIRNTNTKIILRLPDENDRRISGKAAALKDDQVDEIAKLPKGVAVVYQNDWVNPVLCKIDKFNGKEKPFRKSCMDDFSGAQKANSVLINFILKNRLDNPDKLNCKQIVEAIECCDCTAKTKTILYSLSKEYRTKNSLEIWSPKNFSKQSRLVVDVLKLNDAVEDISKSSSDFISFTCGLNTVISQKLDNISDELLLQISHCLIKTYSESVKDGAEFYKAWVEKTVERGKIL